MKRLIVFVLVLSLRVCAETPTAESYVPPEGRSPELQAFDRAALFLGAMQEEDGHWSAARSGAAPEFSGVNGDITCTALATYVMLCTSQGKVQNMAAIKRAKRGIEWLSTHIKPDGRIVQESPTGEPVVAQFISAMAFMQAATMSTRPKLREQSVALVRYAVVKMQSTAGGYGAFAKAPQCRADISGLATFVFKSALMEDIKFSDGAATDVSKLNTEIENNLRAGQQRLSADPEKKNGILQALGSMPPQKGEPDWDATLCGITARTLLLATLTELRPAIAFMLQDYDAATTSYSGLKGRMEWGADGGSFRSLSLWQGTLSSVYLFTENANEGKAWNDAVRKVLLGHQSKNGSWPVAGEDAKRGTVWRASLHALSLILLAPPPPPPQPPTDNGTPPAP